LLAGGRVSTVLFMKSEVYEKRGRRGIKLVVGVGIGRYGRIERGGGLGGFSVFRGDALLGGQRASAVSIFEIRVS
ncbi:MAG: hypothetical protein SPE01_11680, partial [Candidatus Spyradocola sp.]|nr:hypothetical protein [Candidatus Spyradocola sp.]